jgi:opacity protein-like surface antigen
MAFGDVTVEGQGGPFSLVDSLGNWDFLGDAKLGYDLRLSNTPFVLGVFGGYSLGRARVDIGSSEVSSLAPTWNAGARIGIVAWNSTLLYTGYKYQWANLDVRQGEEMIGHSIGGHGLIGGIEYPISKAVTLGLEYGYNRFDRVEFCTAGCGGEVPQIASTRPEAHSVMLRGNVRLGFGQ